MIVNEPSKFNIGERFKFTDANKFESNSMSSFH